MELKSIIRYVSIFSSAIIFAGCFAFKKSKLHTIPNSANPNKLVYGKHSFKKDKNISITKTWTIELDSIGNIKSKYYIKSKANRDKNTKKIKTIYFIKDGHKCRKKEIKIVPVRVSPF